MTQTGDDATVIQAVEMVGNEAVMIDVLIYLFDFQLYRKMLTLLASHTQEGHKLIYKRSPTACGGINTRRSIEVVIDKGRSTNSVITPINKK